MSTEVNPNYAWSGFIDYNSFYPPSQFLWNLTGALICIGTAISVVPQIILIVKNRSSFGLNPVTIFTTSFNQWALVVNIICLHTPDFLGIIQLDDWWTTIPRLLTFANSFCLWIVYLPIVYLLVVFYDPVKRKNRSDLVVKRDKILSLLFACIYPAIAIAFLTFMFVSISNESSTGKSNSVFGKALGTISSVIVFLQYLPQMATTFRLKDSGSLSIIMLAIQAPGGLANTLFMWFGQGDHWTTWISFLVAAIEQFVLLGMCIIFEVRKKILSKARLNDTSLLSTSSKMQTEI